MNLQILQFETEKVLDSGQLSGMCPGAFLKVLEQDTVSVEEIDLWRAALKWARQKGSFLLSANIHRKPLLKGLMTKLKPRPPSKFRVHL